MANETFNPNGYSENQIAAALAGVGDLQSSVEQMWELLQYLAAEEPKNKVKYRAAWVFGDCDAGESNEETYTISASIISKCSGNPVCIISPILTSDDTYNPDLHYYAYIIHDGGTSDGTLVIGVHNSGSASASVPDAAVVVL